MESKKVLRDADNQNSVVKETIELEYPFKLGGQEYWDVKLRRPLTRDIRAVDHIPNDQEKTLALITNLGEIPPKAVDEIDGKDLRTISSKIESFLGLGEL